MHNDGANPTTLPVARVDDGSAGSDLIGVAVFVALVGSVVGAISEFLPTLAHGSFHLFGWKSYLVDVGNGLSYLQADVATAAAALWLALTHKHRTFAAGLLVFLGSKYVITCVGTLLAVWGSHLVPGPGAWLGLISSSLVLAGGLIGLVGARPTS